MNNNQNNMNNNFNNQNNGYQNNNMNNNFNNQNNMNNGYPNNNMNYTPNNYAANQTANKSKKWYIIGGVALVIIVIALIGGGGSGGKHYTCKLTSTSSGKTLKSTEEIYFNKEGYKMKIYSTIEVTYPSTVTDSEYAALIDSLGSAKCINSPSYCKGSHLELGITGVGWNTVVDRSGSKVTIKSNTLQGSGGTASSSDISNTIDSYKNKGYSCS